MDRPELSCAEVEPMLPLVADGALDADGDPALFAHLARCEACQEALARHDLISLALAQPAPAVPQPIRFRLPLPLAVASAAALLAAVTGAWWLATRPAAEAEALARREVIRVVRPGEPQAQPVYLIRDGERIDPARLEFGRDGEPTGAAAPPGAVPVGVHY